MSEVTFTFQALYNQ